MQASQSALVNPTSRSQKNEYESMKNLINKKKEKRYYLKIGVISERMNFLASSPNVNEIIFNKAIEKNKKISLFLDKQNIKELKRTTTCPVLPNKPHSVDLKEKDKSHLNLSTLFGIKDIRNILTSNRENEGILIPLIRKFIYKLKKNTLFYKFKQLNDGNLAMINDIISNQNKNEKRYNKESLGKKRWFSKAFEKKIFELMASLPIINPHDNLKVCWDILHMVLTFFLLFWIPIDVCFVVNMPSFFSLGISLFFMCDIFLNLNTAYFQNGYIVMKRKKIFRNYFSKFFMIDVITAIIYIIDLFFINESTLNHIELIKLFLFIRLSSLSQIYDKLLEKFKIRLKVHNSFIDLINLLFYSLLIIHIFACFWNYVGETNVNRGLNTWIEYDGLVDSSIQEKYLYSLYWSSVTIMTVGYGDVTAHNQDERIYSILAIVVGCGVFAYVINTIGIIIGDINKENMLFKQNLNIITNYMERKHVNYNLQMKIREYLRFIWKVEFTQNEKMEDRIIGKLSKSLKEELFLEANGKILNKYPMFFANFSECFLRQLMYKMKEVRHTPEDLIFSEGKNDDKEIYFILKGKVQLFMSDNKNNEDCIILKDLKEGECFGEISFFTGGTRSASAQSKDFTTLCLIKREDFIDLLCENPEDYEKYRMITDQINFENNYNALSIKCFSCDQKGHLSKNCPLIHYTPDVGKIVKVYTFNPGQNNRVQILRNPAKSSNALGIKTQSNRAFQKFQRLLRQLYVMDNETFQQDSKRSSISSNMDEDLIKDDNYNIISPIEVNSATVVKSNFNDSLLKPQFCQKTENLPNKNPILLYNGVSENNIQEKKKNFNKIHHSTDPNHNDSNENNKELGSPYDDLKINTSISKSAFIKTKMKKEKELLHMNEIIEINSNSESPEKGRKPSNNDSLTNNFINNNNISINSEGPDIKMNEINDKFQEFLKENQTNEILKYENLNDDTPSNNNNNDKEIQEKYDNFFTFDNLDKNSAIIGNQKENNKSGPMNVNKKLSTDNSIDSDNETKPQTQTYTLPSLNGHRQSIFSVRKGKRVKSHNPSWGGPLIPAIMKKRSVTEFFNSPLLKLPIYNIESPPLLRNKSGSETTKNKDKKRTETESADKIANIINLEKVPVEENQFLPENLDYDRVCNFKNYHPENNVKNIIKKMSKARKLKPLIEYKKRPNKRHLTKNFKNYFDKEKNKESDKNIRFNRIFPSSFSSPNSSPLKRHSDHFNTVNKTQIIETTHKRPSSIFTSNLRNKNFFQHESNEITFYDVVYEVLTNKELRKKLMLEKMKSKNKKKTASLLKKN